MVLPTGGFVTVETTNGALEGKYLNVYMRGSPRDRELTEGLCGSLDGDKRNDINMELDKFNQHWRSVHTSLLASCQFNQHWRSVHTSLLASCTNIGGQCTHPCLRHVPTLAVSAHILACVMSTPAGVCVW